MMKVNGKAFLSARKKIRAAYPGKGTNLDSAIGTQQWLADESKLSLRAVQYLERGEASLKTLEAVSGVLKIQNWQEYITDFGKEYVTCNANNLIDFRPELYPPNHQDTFSNSIFTMIIDPVSVLVESGKFKDITLKRVTAKLLGLGVAIDFEWLAEVNLTPAGHGWLGWVSEISETLILANDKAFLKPILFKQTSLPIINWGDFISQVDDCKNNQIQVELNFEFSRFTKQLIVFLSVELLQKLFDEGRKKYSSDYPHRVQLKTITFKPH